MRASEKPKALCEFNLQRPRHSRRKSIVEDPARFVTATSMAAHMLRSDYNTPIVPDDFLKAQDGVGG